MNEYIGVTDYLSLGSDWEIQAVPHDDKTTVEPTFDAEGDIDTFIESDNKDEYTIEAEYRGTDLGAALDLFKLGKNYNTNYCLDGIDVACEAAKAVKASFKFHKHDSNNHVNSTTPGDHDGYDLDAATIFGTMGKQDVPTAPVIGNSDALSDLVSFKVSFTAEHADRLGGDGEHFDGQTRGGRVTITHKYIGKVPTLTGTSGWTQESKKAPEANRTGDEYEYVHTKALSPTAVPAP